MTSDDNKFDGLLLNMAQQCDGGIQEVRTTNVGAPGVVKWVMRNTDVEWATGKMRACRTAGVIFLLWAFTLERLRKRRSQNYHFRDIFWTEGTSGE